MRRAKWPNGVPVFQIIASAFTRTDRNNIAVGVGIRDDIRGPFTFSPWIELLIGKEQRRDAYKRGSLIPLNADARAMLAIARSRR